MNLWLEDDPEESVYALPQNEDGNGTLVLTAQGDLYAVPGSLPPGPGAVSLTLDRSTDGGRTWHVVQENVGTGELVELTDFQGRSHGDTYYRLTAYATTGASSETVLVSPADSAYAWLAAGPDFDAPIAFAFNPTRDREVGRARSTQEYLGRAFPVAYAGENLSDTLTVGGTIVREEISGDSRLAGENDLVRVAQDPYPVHLWRDPEGHHAYVSVGSPTLSRETAYTTGWGLTLVRVDAEPILGSGL